MYRNPRVLVHPEKVRSYISMVSHTMRFVPVDPGAGGLAV